MTRPCALVLGAGRMAGGFLAPLLSDDGWRVTLASRTPSVVAAINAAGGVRVRTGATERWISGVRAVAVGSAELDRLIAGADLVATATGPSALPAVAARVAPALRERALSRRPLNVLLLENHRRAGEIFAGALLAAAPALAPRLGRTLGVAEVVAWRAVSARAVGSEVVYTGDDIDECYVDAASLVAAPGSPDQPIPGLEPARPFELRMIEKLWLFNGGHAAAAYVGRLRGHATLADAMADAVVADAAGRVFDECRIALDLVRSRSTTDARLPGRSRAETLRRYADPALRDPIVRVARGPRRKLAAGDRLLGPAVACTQAGVAPRALAAAAAAALRYREPTDPESVSLAHALGVLGAEEALVSVANLDRHDEILRLILAADAAPLAA